MAGRGGYHTRQRDVILRFFMAHPRESFTARDLIGHEAIQAGEATVYRTLVRLCEQGYLRRFTRSGGDAACFQYNALHDCQSHFHLMCVLCGNVLHMDCGFAREMTAHLAQDHALQVDFSSTMIYGTCAACAKSRPAKICLEHPHDCKVRKRPMKRIFNRRLAALILLCALMCVRLSKHAARSAQKRTAVDRRHVFPATILPGRSAAICATCAC